jgi:hypothetical protein
MLSQQTALALFLRGPVAGTAEAAEVACSVQVGRVAALQAAVAVSVKDVAKLAQRHLEHPLQTDRSQHQSCLPRQL